MRLVFLVIFHLVEWICALIVSFHGFVSLSEFVTATAVANELAFLGEGVKEVLGVYVGGERLDGAVEVALGEDS